MANSTHLQVLDRGVGHWNQWRAENPTITPDLSSADLSDRNLRGANFSRGKWRANLIQANLGHSDLSEANMDEASLNLAQMTGTKLIRTTLRGAEFLSTTLHFADLSGADCTEGNFWSAMLANSILRGTHMNRAKLWYVSLNNADLTGADLSEAELYSATLVRAIVEDADFSGARVFGTSAWSLTGTPRSQKDLEISDVGETAIKVDNIEVAQFIYLLLNNAKVRDVIDTVTSKVVLILGNFSDERKPVLDALRDELRREGLAPILFDFAKPRSKDVTGTVETLARMARFIIADLTDPSSIPHELALVVPFLRTTPVLPLRLAGARGYSMFQDFSRSYQWVMRVHEYQDSESLISSLSQTIQPALNLADTLRSTG